MDLGNPAALKITGSMSWSAWIYATANPADDGQIVAKSGGTGNAGWKLKTSPDTGPHTFGVAVSSNGTAVTQRYSSTVRALNTWYHVAGVYNATAATLDIYVNGVLNNGVLSGTVPTVAVQRHAERKHRQADGRVLLPGDDRRSPDLQPRADAGGDPERHEHAGLWRECGHAGADGASGVGGDGGE